MTNCQVSDCDGEAEEIQWSRKGDDHVRGYPLHELNKRQPHWLCKQHQCMPDKPKPCRDVIYQGTDGELVERGLGHRVDESKGRCLYHLQQLDMMKADSKERRKRRRGDSEGQEQDVDPPRRQITPSIYLYDLSKPLQVPQILGRQLLLPNGYLLLMPTVAEDASKELHRLVIERWKAGVDNSGILTPGTPSNHDLVTLATTYFPPHTFVPLDNKQEVRVVELLAGCEAGSKQHLVASTTMTAESSGTFGDQREARLEATKRLYNDGLIGLLDGVDDYEIKRFEGFVVLSTPGHVLGNESGLIKEGAGLYVKQLFGTRLWAIGDELLLTQQGDELRIPPHAAPIYSYGITASLIQCHHVVSYDWIASLTLDIAPIVKIYLCFMVLAATNNRDITRFGRFFDATGGEGSEGLEGLVAQRLEQCALGQATRSSA